MKKLICVILTIFVLSCTLTVLAGDMPEGIMTGEYCNMMFIGEISEVGDSMFTISPIHTMIGEATSDFEIDDFRYYQLSEKPKIGDIVVAITGKDDSIVKDWIFKASSTDYRTLKLICPNDPNPQNGSNMTFRYNKYINEGKYVEAGEMLRAGQTTSSSIEPIPTDKCKEMGDFYNLMFVVGGAIAVIALGVLVYIFISRKRR